MALNPIVRPPEASAGEMGRLKSDLKGMWMMGDYDLFSRYLAGGARDFYDRLSIAPGSRLLDVACGAGQLALLAAREGVDVTGVDIATNLVDHARIRARAEGLRAEFHEGDAEDLPFEDAAFDAVVSLIGAMFAPRPERVAREMLRVCCPGGTIAMANWTPGGFVGRMFGVVARFAAPSSLPSPVLWGDEATVRERFGRGVSDLSLERRDYLFDFPFPPTDVVELFRLYYGPTRRVFASLDDAGRNNLRRELVALWSYANLAEADLTVVKADYLEVVGQRL